MTRARMDGLYLIMLGSSVFVLLGISLVIILPCISKGDFQGMFYSASCALHRQDPYNQANLIAVYEAAAPFSESDPAFRTIQSFYCYFPNAFAITVPFALMPFWAAQVLWLFFIAITFIAASLLMWIQASNIYPRLTGALVCLLLCNSGGLLLIGNAAGIAVSLCVIAVWCFLNNRYIALGILCLAISLTLKPNDTGLIWVYFLLAGRVQRRRALLTAALTGILALPCVFWISTFAPHWRHEIQANIAADSAPGHNSDPGPNSLTGRVSDSVIDFQTVTGMYFPDPAVYNRVAWLLTVPLILFWAFALWKYPHTKVEAWYAIASISALSMLPLYHRQHDAKLILLTLPAAIMLMREQRLQGRIALVLSIACFSLIGDLWLAKYFFIERLIASGNGLVQNILSVILSRPEPIILFATAIFYLWVFVGRTKRSFLNRSVSPTHVAIP
ncbi:MAG TPA: hypothetical protein VG893_09745 [Terracidiphilus sp.]|nr:hypothetical protein [Terracidiphilus sp.]